MITASSVCTDVELLNIISILKKIIGFGCIIVPVILVILVSIDIITTVSSSEVDTKKLFNAVSKRIIASIIVFLIPFITNFVLSIIPMEKLYYVDCYNNATDENIRYIAENNVIQSMAKLNTALLNDDFDSAYLAYEETRINIKKIPNKELREEYNQTLENLKVKVNNLKDETSTSAPIEPTEGDYQTDASASKYNYNYIKSNLNKYDISQDRIDIVLKAASYAGRIPYHWAGTAQSKDFATNRFGTPVEPDYNGRAKKGLDCSHFVDFVFWQVMDDNLGNGNTDYIWTNKTTEINEGDLLPGDVGFQNHVSDEDNHIGIYAGTDNNGKKIWIHMAGMPNNTVVINNTKFSYYRRVNILR